MQFLDLFEIKQTALNVQHDQLFSQTIEIEMRYSCLLVYVVYKTTKTGRAVLTLRVQSTGLSFLSLRTVDLILNRRTTGSLFSKARYFHSCVDVVQWKYSRAINLERENELQFNRVELIESNWTLNASNVNIKLPDELQFSKFPHYRQ